MDETETNMYQVIAKGYPSVTISLNGETVSYAEVFTTFSGPAVASVRLTLKEGDKLTHTGHAMQLIKI